MPHLWIRADASTAIGIGHVLRTLAVAERAAQRRLPATYLVATATAAGLVRARGMDAIEVEPAAWAGHVAAGDLVLIDGYGVTPAEERAARGRGARVAAIDDRGEGPHDVDVLLDQNPHPEVAYDLPTAAVRLLGPRHALVRGEVLRRRRLRGGGPAGGTLLLTFGGSDPTGLTGWALDVLAGAAPFAHLLVLVGPAAADHLRVPDGVEVVRAPADPAAIFDRADAAVSAAGSTTWELLAMGVPTAVVAAVDNQVPVRDGVARLGVAATFDRGDGPAGLRTAVGRLADPATRAALSAAGLGLVDGRGADRLLAALLDG